MTGGQPWLVNALAAEVTDVLVTDRAKPIQAADIERARESLLARRTTHLDNLTDKLCEPRVRAVIEPMLAGDFHGRGAGGRSPVCRFHLGLVQKTPDGGLDVANPIYREVIARELASGPRDTLPKIAPTWLTPEGRIDAEKLLVASLAFWRRHGEPLLKSAPYSEVAAHLVLMAFLYCVANGGGTLEREYAIGRGRMDLVSATAPTCSALKSRCGATGGPIPSQKACRSSMGIWLAWISPLGRLLAILDQRSAQPPIEERTRLERAVTPSGRPVAVIRA